MNVQREQLYTKSYTTHETYTISASLNCFCCWLQEESEDSDSYKYGGKNYKNEMPTIFAANYIFKPTIFFNKQNHRHAMDNSTEMWQ